MMREQTALSDIFKGKKRTLHAFKRLGLATIWDMLLFWPKGYEDKSRITPIAALRSHIKVGAASSEYGVLTEGRVYQTEHGQRITTVWLERDNQLLALRFFKLHAYLKQKLRTGHYVRAYGKVEVADLHLQIVHPELGFEANAVLPDTFLPMYASGGTRQGLRQATWQAAMRTVIEYVLDDAGTANDATLAALARIHFPPLASDIAAYTARTSADHRTVMQEELRAHRICMTAYRTQQQAGQALAIPHDAGAFDAFVAALPFDLTDAQTAAYADIAADMAKRQPMLRMVQGDVGSGKTVLAALAALMAITHGAQVAIMAPTELLAKQHEATFRAWFEPLGVPVVVLAGRRTKAVVNKQLAILAADSPAIAIGTHALFQDAVVFHRLALVVVDEQHRFGVEQRFRLLAKGTAPHQLVMSATPIPRTLAMSLYADLDHSVVAELPKGRKPIDSRVMAVDNAEHLAARLATPMSEGRQAYWVCPLIETNEELALMSAEDRYADLQARLPHVRIGLLHGKMKEEDKNAVMQAFAAHELDMLVATTVIEVGVNVPNASIMVIENAERFGLAQAHQLRGRVGRGTTASQCIFLYQPPLSENARARLAMLRISQDGFLLAEKDLELRGAGQMVGQMQSGHAFFRTLDIAQYAALAAEQGEGLSQSKDTADGATETEAEMETHESLTAREQLVARWYPEAAVLVRV